MSCQKVKHEYPVLQMQVVIQSICKAKAPKTTELVRRRALFTVDQFDYLHRLFICFEFVCLSHKWGFFCKNESCEKCPTEYVNKVAFDFKSNRKITVTRGKHFERRCPNHKLWVLPVTMKSNEIKFYYQRYKQHCMQDPDEVTLFSYNKEKSI